MFDRPDSGERAVIVNLHLAHDAIERDPEEFAELVQSAGIEPLALVQGNRQAPDPKLFVGEGKAEEIKLHADTLGAGVVLFNHTLSPAQERNLERFLHCRVIDRTGVILDIFAQRARTFEGKLQVELAQLQHLSTRLIRGWTHLERQKGGIGLRGPGETQLETDRRLLGERIKQIHKRLDKVRRQREQGRRARDRAEIPTVSLVGYTNAGKSTLFNRLTEATVYVADQLFATLDTTLRRVPLPNKSAIILADTVGFIQQLPHDLVAAFRATLEETNQAELLLHVVDTSGPNRFDRMEQVDQVLAEIDAGDIPQILVFNKVDHSGQAPRRETDADGRERVYLSARDGQGIDLLIEAIQDFFARRTHRREVRIPVNEGQTRARFHQLGRVYRESFDTNGDCLLTVDLADKDYAILRKQEGSWREIPPLAEHGETSPR